MAAASRAATVHLPPINREDLDRFQAKLLAKIEALIAPRSTSILRIGEVQRRTGFGKSSIWAKSSTGDFPSPVSLGEGGRACGWREDEVQQWIESRPRHGTYKDKSVNQRRQQP